MFCQKCGTQNPDDAAFCAKCGMPLQTPPSSSRRPPSKEIGQDAGMRMLLPVGRSGLAIVAGYLGLFAVLCVPAPLALLFGILAVRDIKANPEKHGMGRAVFGIVMGVLGTIALVIGCVMAITNASHR